MAIVQLPRPSAATVGTGGRTRKARLATAADVPQVGSVRDPGLQVPDFAAPIAGLEDVGTAISAAGERLAAAEDRINKRRESVERIRAARDFNEFANDTLTDFSSTRDFSRQEDIEEYGATINKKAGEIIDSFKGSEEGRLRLEARIEPILQIFSDKAAVASVKAQDALVDQQFGEFVNDLSARSRLGEDPDLLIAEGMAQLDAEKDALRPGQEIAFERNLKSRVFSAKIDSFMAKGAFDDAEEMLDNSEVRAAIGQQGQRRMFDRLDKARREGRARVLTETETTQMGFPAGVVVQRKGDGSFNVLFKPEQDETERSRKIGAIETQLTNRGVTPEEARNRAVNLVDGNIRIEIVPGLGVAREVNEVDGTAREVPLGDSDLPGAGQQPPQRTLFDLAQSGAIAGIVPAVQELLGGTVGQIPGVPVAEDVIQARQEVRVAQNELIRALSINPRFPVGEINRIREEIKIEPSLFDSERSLLARMRGIDSALRIRLATEQSAAEDTGLPQDTRSSAAQAVKNIGNFLQLLGVPEGFDEDQAAPEGVPDFSNRIGVTKDGNEVWQSPDGKKWVVE